MLVRRAAFRFVGLSFLLTGSLVLIAILWTLVITQMFQSLTSLRP